MKFRILRSSEEPSPDNVVADADIEFEFGARIIKPDGKTPECIVMSPYQAKAFYEWLGGVLENE